jgi:hypothetical protein
MRSSGIAAVRRALVTAWRNAAPKRLAAQFDRDQQGSPA